jgi:dephospho-CoA kinase
MNNSPDLQLGIQSLFGKKSFENGHLNRDWLATHVFHQPDQLAQLNALVHPAVAEDFSMWVHTNTDHPYLVKEAALLFETGTYRKLDHTVLVTAPLQIRTQRIQQRDAHRSASDIAAIMAKQLTDEEKAPLASTILVNDGRELLLPQILKLHAQFSHP